MGRPTVVTPEVLAKLRDAFLFGATDAEACLYANIARQTLYNYQLQNPDFVDQKEEWKENPVMEARKKVVDDIKVNVDSAKWYLERKAKKEFSLRKEITGEDGKPLGALLDELESDYDEIGREARKQMVENDPPIQDQE